VSDKKRTASDIQAYVDSIQKSVKAWHAIHFPDKAANLADEVRRGLERCGRVGGKSFAPLIMAALHKGCAASELAAFLAAAERFVFVVSRLCQRRSNTGDSEFYRLASQLNRGDTSLRGATALIEERTEKHFSLDKAKLEIGELFTDGDGYYAWSGRYYFLFEYEQHLKDVAGMQAVKVNWDEFTASKKDHVTVEHVYPRTPKAGEWPSFEARSDIERHNLRHSLGNLLPLSQSRNSKFSNRSFATKKQESDGVRGYFNGSYSEIAVAQKDDWTPKEVLERGIEMLAFLEQRWSVSLGDRADKVELLRLDFLETEQLAKEYF